MRKKIYDEVSRNEERWRAIFDNSGVGIALNYPTGHFTIANRAYQQMVGYSEEELCKLSYLDITYEEDRETNVALGRNLWDGKIGHFQHEKRYRRKDASASITSYP